MPVWINALLFSILVVTIPFTMILRILLQLPKPQALSQRRWPSALNLAIIGAITAYVAGFIRSAYYVRPRSPVSVLLEFIIAAVAYGFGLALILRQFSGIYPEYLVTTGAAGLGIRKIAYRNIEDVEEVWRGRGETRLRIHTVYGNSFLFILPTRSVPLLHENLKSARPPE
jgi:hypothetical protein